ncbi:ABC transporter ATP-binding protein [Pseudonocardia sp. GCM10023141]|uniref:ABC transporter ATP-binding protein n=1 Tax=Pseudonocardia sp. GCM10023141 TaxID=3252653 RepID=UPI00361BC122
MTALPVATAARTRSVVGALLRPLRLRLALMALVFVAGTVAVLAIPLLLGGIVDAVIGGGPATRLDLLAAGVLAAVIVAAALGATGSVLLGRLGETMLAQLRERVVDRALHVPLATIERGGTGDLLSRVSGDVAVASEGIRSALPALVTAVLELGLTIVGLGLLDWRLALAGLLPMPIWLLVTRWYIRTSGPRYATAQAAAGRRTQSLLEGVGGAATVRAYRLQESTLRRIARDSVATVTADLKAFAPLGPFGASINGAELLGTASVLTVGFLLVQGGAVTVGAATAAALYFLRLFNPIGLALFLFDQAQYTSSALARLVGVVDLPVSPEPVAPREPADATVRLRGIRHAYDGGDDVLHGIDLDVAAGERLAVVGASGAGKTTLGAIIAGMHEPTSGTVEIGGAALTALREPHRHVALVTQEVHLFAGTVADNLLLAADAGSPGEQAGPDELATVLRRVGATVGLDDVVGDGGDELGATQAQQLALARLLLVDPAVAVLDEATAEAGSAGSRVLERAADAALQGRTAVVIAHRLTQAVSADRIVVLDKGRIVETGSHAELVAAHGRYAQLWEAWNQPR